MGNKTATIHNLQSAKLNWYPFPGGEQALLLGQDPDPLRKLLERNYSVVEAVDLQSLIQRTELLTDAQTSSYDIVVATDVAETTENLSGLLKKLYTLLAENGVLLLVYRNRFGLKYLCGGVDDYSKYPFSGLCPPGDNPRLYARREMESVLMRAGFACPHCYFLMPDADFVQAVYTEEYLPTDSIRDRVFPFDLHNSPLIAWEGDLYDDMVREGTLPYVANVYLAECRKPGAAEPEKRVIYAALSTDRGPEHSFATVLYSDETACKQPLFPESRKALETLCRNMEALKSSGILTVEHRLTDRGVEMSLIREEGLLHYLRRQLPENPEEFLAVFERIYQDVLQASELSEALPGNMGEIWGAEPAALEPVLKTAWIDMIPYNAFWANGRMRYYDQEFLAQNCPAKYVLFRALRYTWLHIPEAEQTLSLECVKERFGLTELWEGFQKREDRFVAENRNWEALSEIYAHSAPDRVAMEERRKAMDPSSELRDVHKIQLELLKELDRVCKEHRLRYMAIHGTLLGAVRHHGFIPWDDDVDIAMPREDYDRLLTLGNPALSEGFFIQTPRNNYGCFYGGYSKLRRHGTAAIEPQHKDKSWHNCHQGIWIDIFPIDFCPEDKEEQKKLQHRLNVLQRIIYAKAYEPEQFVPKDVKGKQKGLYYLLSKCTRRRDLLRMIDGICRGNEESSLCGILACYYGEKDNKNIWSASAVTDVKEMPFEDMTLPVPVGWDEILHNRYGENYLSLPPMSKRYRHSDVVFWTGEEE